MKKETLRYLKKKLMRFILTPLKLIRVKENRVLLHNDMAQNYSANPKYIAEYLLKYYPGCFDIVFSVRHPDQYKGQKGNIRFVRFNSIKYFYYAMTSKVLVTNSGGISYIPLRKTQFVINTHHGGGCYKSMGGDMFENTPLFRKDLNLSSKQTSLFLSTCRKFTNVITNEDLPLDKIWEIGMPRNDILIHPDIQLLDQVRSRLGLNKDDKLVLFCPTYRKKDDNYFNDSIAISYGIDCARVCEALRQRFGGHWIFGFRLHPCVTNRDELPKGDIIDLSDYDEMQELLLAADVMINDFSSSMWDFMLTGKPCFTFATDLDHYVRTTKVYTPVEEWPFPKATDNDGLEKNILEFDEKKYAVDCKHHYDALGGCETGEATKLVCERIYEVCFGEKHKE